jgi:hypothetical protein
MSAMFEKLGTALWSWWTTRNRKIVWYEPRWSYGPPLLRSFQRATAPASILRVACLTAIAFAVILGGAKLALPQLQLGGVWWALLALPGIYVYLMLMTALHVAIPPRVYLGLNRIVIQHGKNAEVIFSASIKRASVVVFAKDCIRLHIWYSHKVWRKSIVRSKKIGVAPSVNLNELCQLLPTPPVVWDARNRKVTTKR